MTADPFDLRLPMRPWALGPHSSRQSRRTWFQSAREPAAGKSPGSIRKPVRLVLKPGLLVRDDTRRAMVTPMQSWPAKRRSRWIRALAALFLSAILADVCFDADCDGTLVSGAQAATLAVSSGGGASDACARGCVPDCYCCSQSITTGPAVLPPDAGPVVPMQAPLSTPSPVGVRPVPYRPPLLLT